MASVSLREMTVISAPADASTSAMRAREMLVCRFTAMAAATWMLPSMVSKGLRLATAFSTEAVFTFLVLTRPARALPLFSFWSAVWSA